MLQPSKSYESIVQWCRILCTAYSRELKARALPCLYVHPRTVEKGARCSPNTCSSQLDTLYPPSKAQKKCGKSGGQRVPWALTRSHAPRFEPQNRG